MCELSGEGSYAPGNPPYFSAPDILKPLYRAHALEPPHIISNSNKEANFKN
jgi:hypothetical protein